MTTDPRASSPVHVARNMRHDDPVPIRDLDSVMAAGRLALLSGGHDVEDDPTVTRRWGPSLVLRPGGAIADRLAELTAQVVDIIGEHHWSSGGLGRAHVTV